MIAVGIVCIIWCFVFVAIAVEEKVRTKKASKFSVLYAIAWALLALAAFV